jgi:hypothetical protein
LFNPELLGDIESLWTGGASADPWPGIPPVPSVWEGALPALREMGEGFIAGVSEYFSPSAPAPETEVEIAGSTPTVDEVLAYHRSFEKVEGGERERLWQDSIARLRAEGFPYLPTGETYASFRSRLDALGPHVSDRIVSLRSALTLLRNHDALGLATSELPVAVVIGPASDYNQAFTSFRGYPVLDSLIDSGRFNVLYFEASNETEACEALMTAHGGTGRRLHTVVFAGHGLRTALALGGPDPGGSGAAMGPEEDFIDIGDLQNGFCGDLDAIMEPEGQILMWSCSNGDGGRDALNLANGMAESAPGRRVYSTPVPSNLSRLAVREDLSLDLAWHDTDGYIATHDEGDPSVLNPDANETVAAVQISETLGRNSNTAVN